MARAAYGKLIAMLASRSGDIAAAEDALADAFVAALSTWPERGVPKRPEAWLLTVARNRRTDRRRRDKRLSFTDDLPELPSESELAASPSARPMDHRLKLMFVCAHPAIDASLHTPLMLQTVLGIEASDIASAFLVSPAAMAQRLVRAKRKIKAARIPFQVPEPGARPARVHAVMEAIYGAYALDWFAGEGGDLTREALFLSATLKELMPDHAEALGLSALLSFVEARRGARFAPHAEGDVLVPVTDQDPERWDPALLTRGSALLERASALGALGRFQLEAAIQSVHADRRMTGRTDWVALAQLYAGLVTLYPTLGAAVSQAAVVAETEGPAQGLAMLDRIDGTERYQPAFAVRAHCLARLGRNGEALAAYDRALALCTDAPSRRWLVRQAAPLRLQQS
ncbi:MAG: DUF6596 domain-containing protein [Myxococcota bacterium]